MSHHFLLWKTVREISLAFLTSRFFFFFVFSPTVMYQFPGAAITKYHKSSGLKQQGFIVSVLENSSLKLKDQQGSVSSVACKKESFHFLIFFWPLITQVSRNFWKYQFRNILCQPCLLPLSDHVCLVYMSMSDFLLFYEAPRFTELVMIYRNNLY